MAELKHRLARLERLVHASSGKYRRVCGTCQGVALIVFEDDPQNLWPYGADGYCPTCGKPPPERIDLCWSRDCPEMSEFLRSLPFDLDPCHGKLGRLSLVEALLLRGDLEEGERVVARLYEQQAYRASQQAVQVQASARR